MRAVIATSPGGPLEIADVPSPVAGPGEVLLEVWATAVNRADLLQRQGLYPPPAGAPEYLGLECSGVVVGHGPGVNEPTLGTPVCALLSGGGYAEQVAVPVGQLLPVPSGVDLVAAASLPEVACTVHSNLYGVARLQSQDTVLIHGGSSGIGTFASQLAAARGSRVAVTAGSPAKLERCRELGAQILIDYRAEDFVERVRQATDGRGADVILDNMGAAYLARNIDALAVGGRLVVIGLQGGTKGELDLGRLLRKRAAVHATSLRARSVPEKAAIVAAVRREVWPLIESGVVAPVIDRVLRLTEAEEAHRVVGDSVHVGKVVLKVRDGGQDEGHV